MESLSLDKEQASDELGFCALRIEIEIENVRSESLYGFFLVWSYASGNLEVYEKEKHLLEEA